MASQWNKQKNVLLGLEEINPEIKYAITYNPCDKYQHFKDGHRLNKCMDELKTQLFYSTACYSLCVYPELSKNGRFHVHGTIVIKDPIQWCLHHVHHLTNRGTMVIKPITDSDIWNKYITKQDTLHAYIKNQTFNEIPIIK